MSDRVKWTILHSGAAELVAVTDKNDGTYHVSWKYNRQGSHQISVSLERDQKGSLCGDLDGDGLIDEVCHAEFSPTTSRVLRVSADALQPPNPGSSYAYGAALFAAEAGVPSTIYVQSRKLRVSTQTFDEFNRSSITGGADVKARALLVLENDPDNVTVAGGFDFSVIDKKDGIYEIVYNARVVGTYYLEATLNGEPIGLCEAELGCSDAEVMPFVKRLVTLYPGPTSPDTSSVIVTSETLPQAGRKSSFNIDARDAVGNLQQPRPYVLTPDAFEVYLVRKGVPLSFLESDALTKSVLLTQTETGSGYSVEYSPRISGKYSVHVELRGKPIKGTPFEQEVKAGAINARYSTLSGIKPGQTLQQAIDTAKALEWMNFTVNAADEYRNFLTSGGDAFNMFVQVIRVESNEEFTASISDNGDGTYMASFMPTLTGTYQVLLAINGVKVLPTAGLSVTGQGVIRQVAVYGPLTEAEGAASEKVTAGVSSFFDVQAYDRQGRIKAAGGDIVAVEIVPTTNRNDYGIALLSHRPVVRDQARFVLVDKSAVPGRYRVSLLISEFGLYDMKITINGDPIKGSPFQLTVLRLFPPVQDVARFSNTATKIVTRFLDVVGNPTLTNRGGLIGIEPCSKAGEGSVHSPFTSPHSRA